MNIDWSVPVVTLTKTSSGYIAEFTFAESVYREYLKLRAYLKKIIQ